MRGPGRLAVLMVGAVLIAPARGVAQPVAGRVIDGATGEGIAGVTLTVDGDHALATTAPDGTFAIAALDPAATLIVLADGYEAALLTAADVEAGEIVLLPVALASETIEVEATLPPAAPGAARMDRDEIERMPGARGDALGSLDALPGVTGGAGTRGVSGVTIRGSAPEDSKILVDGFEIPVLFHLGLRSVIPTAAIASLEYVPGGFDIAYGRASSGIVEVTTRGGGDALRGQAETSVIDGGAVGHGPVGERGTVLVAVRRSIVDLVLPHVIPEDTELQLTTVPRYWDGQLRYDRRLSSRWTAAVSALGTADAAMLYTDDEADPDQRYLVDTSFARVIGDLRFHAEAWTARVAVSPIVQDTRLEIGRALHYRAEKRGVTARTEVARTWRSAWGLTDVVARGGAEVDVARRALDLAIPLLEDEGEPPMPTGPSTAPAMTFDDTIWVTDLAGWAGLAASLSPSIRVSTGVRVDAFVRTSDVAVQPRGELAIRATPRTRVRLVAGAYRRPAEFLTEVLDRSLDPECATQTIVGVEHDVADGVRAQGSLYHTDRSYLLTRADDGSFANQGRGTTIGAELLVTARRGPWAAFVSYALSRSTRVDRPGGAERRFDHDQPHDVNVAVSHRRGPWQIGGRFTYSSGVPLTELRGAYYDSDRDLYVPLYGDPNALRLPSHHQLDIRIDRTWTAGRIRITAFLDVANVYLNAPSLGVHYNFDYTTQTQFESLPIVPSLGVRGEL